MSRPSREPAGYGESVDRLRADWPASRSVGKTPALDWQWAAVRRKLEGLMSAAPNLHQDSKEPIHGAPVPGSQNGSPNGDLSSAGTRSAGAKSGSPSEEPVRDLAPAEIGPLLGRLQENIGSVLLGKP